MEGRSFTGVRFVCAIPSSAMADGANRLMTKFMTGFRFGADSAICAGRCSLTRRPSLHAIALQPHRQQPGVAALLCGTLRLGRPAAPALKDPQRVTDPPTLRRWLRSLDSSRPPYSFLRPTMDAVTQALDAGKLLHLGCVRLCWQTLFPFLIGSGLWGSEKTELPTILAWECRPFFSYA